MFLILYIVFFINILIEVFCKVIIFLMLFLVDVKYFIICEVVISIIYFSCVFIVIVCGNVLVILVFEKNW